MKWEMEILSPTTTPYNPNSNLSNTNNTFNWLLGDGRSTRWTPEENKLFENALAVHDKDTPDRWHQVAAMIPGKTVGDVIKQYKELEVDVCNIEAGLIPVPGYSTTSPFTLEWVNSQGYDDGFKGLSGKRPSSCSVKPPEQERKKGVPWTEEEHKLFLLGLKKYGKGDWRNISRNFVITRTPTQVASHAQKYFIRQLSGGKDKRRASIHDITTVNVTETGTSSSEDTKSSMMLSQQQQQQNSSSAATIPRTHHFQWNNQQPNNAAGGVAMEKVFNSPYGVNSFGVTIMEGQNLNKSVESSSSSSYLGPQTQNLVFQMQQQSSQQQQHYSHA
ncbi:hypothetical protein HN51_024938 [Arachis hypogaea]|uniref:Transcription factor DIVARICATA n=2 Tax=Arachis TaxID=3817 RepID=A0A445C7T9_ARAHY|nr:transcription factor DIVARICATA [Arachis duranensis]XP_025609862.1 transcription factor DIVARICATA [Arachis hypogaea]QHO28031.1 Transcription factor DIVARICATA [Arachis hypogaea]RYR47015.1 hypothetical protein Ahy_A07g032913 [Arachis hypogaea]